MAFARIDHIILHVDDMGVATAQFAAHGFSVQSRADAGPSHGTESRFVVMEDGAYILLMRFSDPAKKAAHRLHRFLKTDLGFVDYGIGVDDAGAAETRFRALELEPSRTMEMRNVLADGTPWGVRLFTVGRGAPGGRDALPFVVQDLAAREGRVPAFRAHANGARRIAALHIEARDPQEAARLLSAGIGVEAVAATEVAMGEARVIFRSRDPKMPATSGEGGVVSIEMTTDGGGGRELNLANARFLLRG